MSTDRTSDAAAQVGRRLSKMARQTGENLTFVLERFAAQRLLYRLSVSPHRDSFALKGAVLLAVWSPEPYRATRDIDLLGWGENSADRLEQVFREVCALQVEGDGLSFDAESIVVEEIRENQEYGGLRVKLRAYLDQAWVVVQIDVGFGDAITPEAVEVECPTMLDFAPAMLRAYPRETVIAEKAESMVRLGLVNSRMKDFSDLYYLASEFEFDGRLLTKAIIATFSRRQTPLPQTIPVALTERFYGNADTKRQWAAFLQTARMSINISLEDVCEKISEFLMPVIEAAVRGDEPNMLWHPDAHWNRQNAG